jgi:hypothetical protein
MHSIEGWQGNADARQFARVQAELPGSVARACLHYLALFRPRAEGGRGLIWAKALRLAGEVQLLVAQTRIQWKGQPSRPIDATVWGLAMERLIANPPKKLPLTSHGYLTSIAYDLADEMDRGREVRRNQAERDGSLRREIAAGRAGEDAPAEPLAPEVLRAIRNKNMGRT